MERKTTNCMLIGFARRGKGEGAGVVGYISDGAEAVGYLAGGKKAGKPRNPAPVIIRGNPGITRRLIDITPHRWKYTSAMVSFSPGERITPETERRVVDEFERCAFAGFDRSRYYTLWVRHTDGPGGCHHLHVVTPRMDLLTGKSLNIAPPGKGSRELFDTVRSKLNAELGLSDPEDPRRVQAVRLPQHVAKLLARERRLPGNYQEDVRVLITRHVEEKARNGLVKNREDVARYLRECGFAITREGKGYLTIENGDNGQRVRLRGGLYDQTQCPQVISRARQRGQEDCRRDPERLRALEEKLERLVAARARHNQERYGHGIEAKIRSAKERCHDRLGTPLDSCGSRNGTLLQRTRGEAERALERFGEGTRRLERATRSIVQSSRFLDRAIERAKGRQRERELDQRLIGKYGVPASPPSPCLERGFDRELDMEPV